MVWGEWTERICKQFYYLRPRQFFERLAQFQRSDKLYLCEARSEGLIVFGPRQKGSWPSIQDEAVQHETHLRTRLRPEH